ncbi:MAG: ABC transporter ATP-binding protein, partial [Treponema sp.]|nr:ABC transporter ATP-binding protein [Treponema sp.]
YDPYHAVFPRIRDKLFGKKTVPADDDALVHVCDLAVSFPRPAPAHGALQAVRGVSFSLRRGEILGIVGESGSGKSVTTSAIPGLLPKTAVWSGSVRYDGQELLGLPLESLRAFRGKKIGMIFQEPGRSYDPLQNMEKVFLETFRNSDPTMTREAARKKAVSLLEEVGLDRVEERLGNFPHQFSGGQLQRIGIALALAQGCELLIADEPTTALDVTIQAQIVSLINRIRDERKISVIFISHDIDLVAGISDRILVMYSGLVMEEGPARDVFASPAHPYTRALLAAAPRFEMHYSRDPLDIISGRVPDPSNPPPACPFAPRCRYAAAVCREALPVLESLSESCNPAGVSAHDNPQSTPHRYRCVFTPEKQI